MSDKLLREALEIGLQSARLTYARWCLRERADDVRKIEAAIASLDMRMPATHNGNASANGENGDTSAHDSIASQLDSATVHKAAYLTGKGMKPIGVVMMGNDGYRATIIMGRVMWDESQASARISG